MKNVLQRREFLSALSCALPMLSVSPSVWSQGEPEKVCWLEVCAPFILDDPGTGVRAEIILTSDTFVGPKGYHDGVDRTEYEICLFDSTGRPIGPDGVTKRLFVPAMQTTVLLVRELLGDQKPFFGGLKVRLRPSTRTPMHASDLFSSAFVRWTTEHSFDNVHANPDPVQLQKPDPFFYSMPFPPLREYECIFSVFNPYRQRSSGSISIFDPVGQRLKSIGYQLKPGASLLLDLRRGELLKDTKSVFGEKDPGTTAEQTMLTNEGGTIVVTNKADSVKNFAYMMIRHPERKRFSIEHPIHQSPYDPSPPKVPIDSAGRFKAKNILYTPLVFNSKRIGGITLESKFHLSSGAPIEEFLWLRPFIVDKLGNVPWQMMNDPDQSRLGIPAKQIQNGVLKLGGQQSCVIDSSRLGLPADFSGGLSLAIAPTSNHTLMKVELLVPEWKAFAFTHFRPGLAAARGYQRQAPRGGIATDYITSGARLEIGSGKIVRDEVICVINIDDKGTSGQPELEIFSSTGLLSRVKLGSVPGFASVHYLLSDLAGRDISGRDLSLRLVDQHATLLMSVVHIDHVRRDIAIDHGSDRFSTFQDFNCTIE